MGRVGPMWGCAGRSGSAGVSRAPRPQISGGPIPGRWNNQKETGASWLGRFGVRLRVLLASVPAVGPRCGPRSPCGRAVLPLTRPMKLRIRVGGGSPGAAPAAPRRRRRGDRGGGKGSRGALKTGGDRRHGGDGGVNRAREAIRTHSSSSSAIEPPPSRTACRTSSSLRPVAPLRS